MSKNLTSMNVVLGVVNTGLFKGLQAASARIGKFAGQMKAMGSRITSSFTLPFALITGGAAKMAMDFQKEMTKISTLVLGSSKDLDKYAEGVKRISSVTAVSAQETAEGLFFLTSAGLRGTNALETLQTVNKGVAVGLGESTDLAKVAAAAQNAYGAETITATESITEPSNIPLPNVTPSNLPLAGSNTQLATALNLFNKGGIVSATKVNS